MSRTKQRLVKKMTRIEKRAWDIWDERIKRGIDCSFKIAYAAAVSESNRRRLARKYR